MGSVSATIFADAVGGGLEVGVALPTRGFGLMASQQL